MKNIEPSQISNDTLILFGKVGITGELIDEIINETSTTYSNTFHEQMVARKILSSWNRGDKWLNYGFPVQIIDSGAAWRKGKLRLRVVFEFTPDEEVENESEQPIESSLDEFRE